MKTNISLISLIAFSILGSKAQTTRMYNMKTVSYQIKIEKSIHEVWKVLAEEYTNIGNYHGGLQSSHHINGSPITGLGAARHCTLNNKMFVKEKVIDWQEGKSFKYEVYEWKGMPLKRSFSHFTITAIDNNSCMVEDVLEFQMKPGFLSGLMKGKMRKSLRDALLGHKHYIETGEKNTDYTTLRKIYENL